MLLTRAPLDSKPFPFFVQALKTSLGYPVRLACLRHAASVHPEPGSNSPKKLLSLSCYIFLSWSIKLKFYSVFKDHFTAFATVLLIYHFYLKNAIEFLNFFDIFFCSVSSMLSIYNFIFIMSTVFLIFFKFVYL